MRQWWFVCQGYFLGLLQSIKSKEGVSKVRRNLVKSVHSQPCRGQISRHIPGRTWVDTWLRISKTPVGGCKPQCQLRSQIWEEYTNIGITAASPAWKYVDARPPSTSVFVITNPHIIQPNSCRTTYMRRSGTTAAKLTQAHRVYRRNACVRSAGSIPTGPVDFNLACLNGVLSQTRVHPQPFNTALDR